ncbi:peptide ABC transporter permease [Alsobacter metallidurans]|uniref:Peptide ABC transporter permease n=1 Tax=Alsobacter metallidurans TaxID=340221 RepID=A0A917I649_9HYPH|nr:ABC transporter permease [Alsobacter metallidurans]GGH16938.1 peptide ABC transporter permease [Alsobacter metallidurans]
MTLALDTAEQAAVPAPRSRVWGKLLRNRSALIGGTVVIAFALIAFLGPLVMAADPIKTSWSLVRKAPSWLNWFGTDDLGRDVFARVVYGARASLLAGIVSVTIAVSIGGPLGLIAGYFGGWIDAIISRCTEAMLACPFLILAIALGSVLGASLTNAMIAIGIAAAPIFTRLTRAQTLAVKTEDYVEGARAIGLPDRWILAKYIVPNIFAPILVQATLIIAQAIIAEASLSFLGLGQQPPAPSWGSMLNTGKNFLQQGQWWMSMFPGVGIFLTVLGFNLLGDGLRDALDPRET